MFPDLRQQATRDWSLREQSQIGRRVLQLPWLFLWEALSRSQAQQEVEMLGKVRWTFGQAEAAGVARTLERRGPC